MPKKSKPPPTPERNAADQAVIDLAAVSLTKLRAVKIWETWLPVIEALVIVQSEVLEALNIDLPSQSSKYNVTFGKALQASDLEVSKSDRAACLKCSDYLRQIESWRNNAVALDKDANRRFNCPQTVWAAFRKSAAGQAAGIEPVQRKRTANPDTANNDDLREQLDEATERSEELENNLYGAERRIEEAKDRIEMIEKRNAELEKQAGERVTPAADHESAREAWTQLSAAKARIKELEGERDYWRKQVHDKIEADYKYRVMEAAQARDVIAKERDELFIKLRALGPVVN